MSNLVLVVGGMKTGKSTLLANIAKGLTDRCLIMDPGRSSAFADFPEIPSEMAYLLSQKNYPDRIFKIVDTGDRTRELSEVYGWREEDGILKKKRAFVNGNLFLEDAGAYIDSNLKRSIKTQIKAMKQHGLNLFLSYHSLSEISEDIKRMSPTALFIKKTADKMLFSEIPKMDGMGKEMEIMRAYYRVVVRGESAPQIIQNYDPNKLYKVFRALRLSSKTELPKNPNAYLSDPQLKAISQALCKFSNGKLKLTADFKQEARYCYELIKLRD